MNEHSDVYEGAKGRLIRLREVRTRVGLGATTVYRYLAAGKFPGPVEIGGGRVAWLDSESIHGLRAVPKPHVAVRDCRWEAAP